MGKFGAVYPLVFPCFIYWAKWSFHFLEAKFTLSSELSLLSWVSCLTQGRASQQSPRFHTCSPVVQFSHNSSEILKEKASVLRGSLSIRPLVNVTMALYVHGFLDPWFALWPYPYKNYLLKSIYCLCKPSPKSRFRTMSWSWEWRDRWLVKSDILLTGLEVRSQHPPWAAPRSLGPTAPSDPSTTSRLPRTPPTHFCIPSHRDTHRHMCPHA